MKNYYKLSLLSLFSLPLLFSCTSTIQSTTSDSSSDSDDDSSSTTVSVTKVTLNKKTAYLTIGNTVTLKATVYPSTASNTEVTWSSDDESVATVSSGTVTGVSEGEATITVTTSDGSYTATCLVYVSSDSVSVTGVSLNYSSATLYVGKSMTLIETISPYNATNQDVSWSSSNTSVATVSDGVVKGVSSGSTTITVTTSDGSYTDSCVVTVTEASSSSSSESDDDSSTSYSPSSSDDILQITAAGEYTLSQNYKQVYVNAADAEVIINLNGYTIENSENSPIYVETCDSIDISANSGTESYIKDTRSTYSSDDSSQGKGAIFVNDGDLTLKGKGSLEISANYYNGIHGKDDVKIKNLTLDIEAVNHGIRGNDSIEITSGTIDISCGGDGLHTENSDISSSGKQRGNIEITGGSITINSWADAIDAAYDVNISQESSDTETTITAKTYSYSSYTGETVENSSSKFYLSVPSSYYSSSYTYAAYINSTWYTGTYKTTSTTSTNSGGRGWGMGTSTSYIYEFEKPSSASSFTLYRFTSSSFSTSSYNAKSDAKSFNSSYDMISISSISSSKISFGSWSSYSSSSSAKGIKADNEVVINGGTLNISAYDDGIHANNDNSLENGSSPLGNVTISGGTTNIIKTSNDGIHADYTLAISGGTINITTAYEGLEGNLIKVSGGTSNVYATDDGVNAASGSATPNITVTGGFLDVGVPTSGDTDGLDSNGSITINGGVTIVKGPGSASGNTMGAAAVDADGTVSIKSGSLVVFGGVEGTPSSSVSYSGSTSTTYSAKTYTVKLGSSTSYSTTLKSSASGCKWYSSVGNVTIS